MSSFDFSDIERVNRIELQPNEVVLFHTTDDLLSAAEVAAFKAHFDGTPLEGRIIFMVGDWKVATVNVQEPGA